MSARLVVRMMVVLAVVLSFAGTVFGAATFGVNAERALVGYTEDYVWGGKSLAVDDRFGLIYASYSYKDSISGNYPTVVASYDDGGSWDSKKYVSTQSCAQNCLSRIELGLRPTNGSERLLHIVWAQNGSYNYPIYYSRSLAGDNGLGSFSTPIEIAPESDGNYFRPAVDGLGNLHLVYKVGSAIYSFRIKEDLNGNPAVEGPIAIATGYDPDGAADASGNSYAVIDGVLYKKNYSVDYSSTNWAATGTPYNYNPAGNYPTYAPSLLVKDSSNIFVADYNYVSITEDGGATWKQHDLAIGADPHLALESNGGVIVVGIGVFSRGSKTGNKWSFTTPVPYIQANSWDPSVVSLPSTNKALILFLGEWGNVYTTKEQ